MSKPVWRKQMLRDELLQSLAMSDDAAIAYHRLLMVYRLADGILKDDDQNIARSIGLSVRRWKRARPEIEQHFQAVEGRWRNATEDAEIIEAKRIHEARQAGGKKTAAKRWRKPSVTLVGNKDE